jgi:hypothetical protein
MAVLYVPHFIQFEDENGDPLAGGLLYTYAAGTTTPKAAYTTAAGDIEHTNPIVLDSAGRAVIFISGAYKFVLRDADGVLIRETDNVTSFNASTATNEGFYQTFSGDGATTTFTLSDNLGEDEKAIEIFSEREYSTNGAFASDTGWSGVGWTIAAGVATATGAISTALQQSAGITIVQGKAYLFQATITRSAGTITPTLGGTAGTGRSADGTYSEIIIAGSTQTISFTTSGFTGTVDNVSVRDVGGLTVRDVGDYTVNGTALMFAKAPATGSNNIQVRAPYTLIGAAGAAQVAADNALAAQAAAEGATNAVAYQFIFDDSTSMADPGTGDFRLNNATLASVTAIALDAASSVSGNPDVSDAIAVWGDSTNTIKGQIKISKSGTPATFALYDVTDAVTDNTGWLEVTVSHVDSNGSFTAADTCYFQFTRSGDVGATGAQGPSGTVSGASSATAASDDKVLFLDTGSADGLAYDVPIGIVTAAFSGVSETGFSFSDSLYFTDASDSGNIKSVTGTDFFKALDNLSTTTISGSDVVAVLDADDSNNPKKVTAQDIADLATPSFGDYDTPKVNVLFSGTGTPAVTAGVGVSSITDNGTGDYTLNFTNNFANTNYIVHVSVAPTTGNDTNYNAVEKFSSRAVGSVGIQVGTASGALEDLPLINVTIYGVLA